MTHQNTSYWEPSGELIFCESLHTPTYKQNILNSGFQLKGKVKMVLVNQLPLEIYVKLGLNEANRIK